MFEEEAAEVKAASAEVRRKIEQRIVSECVDVLVQ